MQSHAQLLRRNWIVPAVFAAIGAFSYAATPFVSWQAKPFAWFGIFIGVAFAILTAWRDAFPRETSTLIEADAEAIRIGDASFATDDVVEARTVPRFGRGEARVLVELVLRDGRRLRMLVPQGPAAELLHLIGDRRRSFPLEIPFTTRLNWMLAVVGLPWSLFLLFTSPDPKLLLIAFPFGILPVCAFLATAVLGHLRGVAVIGADGFTTRWIRRERFVPFRDVTQIAGHANWAGGTRDAVVELRSKKKIKLRAFERPNTEAERGAEARALLTHLGEAFKKSEALRGSIADVRALVSRSGRSAREWRQSIGAVLQGGATRYRVAAASPEMLGEIMKDSNGAPDARAGAALALLETREPTARTAVRVAADACADPELRAALLELADAPEDEAAVERALGRITRG